MNKLSISLKGIGIENFKAFGKYQFFNLAPITIITGQNNSGKSALVTALDLLSKNDILSHLDFHLGGLDIGNASQIINSSSGLNQFVFELFFEINPNSQFSQNVLFHVTNKFSLRLCYETGNTKSNLKTLDLIIAEEPRLSIDFGIDYLVPISKECTFDAKLDFNYFLASYLTTFQKEYKQASEDKGKYTLFTRNINNGFYKDSFVTDNKGFMDEYFDGSFFKEEDLNLYPSLKDSEKLISKELSKNQYINCTLSKRDSQLSFFPSNIHSHSNDSLGLISGIVQELLSTEHYSASEDDPKDGNRFWQIIIEHLEKNGEKIKCEKKWINTGLAQEHLDWPNCPKFSNEFKTFTQVLYNDIYSILSLARSEIQKTVKLEAFRATSDRIYLYKEKDIPLTREIINSAENVERKEQADFFRKWTGSQKFNFFEEPTFKKIVGVGYRFIVKKDGAERELADMGFGTRQVIPVILGVFNNKQIPFMIEEPESNLHPKLQSMLADLIVEVKSQEENAGAPLIIETHSEYLIRKLQFLVANGSISHNDVSISYIENINGTLVVNKLEIRKDGILKQDFGEGFFDESLRWTIELLSLKSQN